MKLLAVSDTHNDFSTLHRIVAAHPECSYLLHLGDGCRELDDVATLYPHISMICVRGNCDYDFSKPLIQTVCVGGKKLVLTHGHMHHAKSSLTALAALGRENEADLVLYGHSHHGALDFHEGVLLFNPGSPTRPRLTKPTYGIITIEHGNINCALQLVQP